VTLVLTALTHHEVIQVSDRRFTYLRGNEVLKHDDEKNKAVLFCGRLMFSFTGLGELGMERQTDLWLAGRICDVIAAQQPGDQDTVLRGLTDKATQLFEKPRYKGQRHAFVGVGWARFNPERPGGPARVDEFQPYLAVVSNFHDGHRELPTASPEFSLSIRILGRDEEPFIFDAPHHLSRAETEELTAELVAADQARSLDAIVNSLGKTIRTVAARDDGVGAGLMINCLPRAALGTGQETMVIAGGPLTDTQSFLYVPPSGDTTVQLGPVSTCGSSIMSGFRSEPIPAGTQTAVPSGPTLPDDAPGLVRRWYLVAVVGSGTGDDPYRAEALGRSATAVIPSHGEGHPRLGHPKHDVALVLVSSDDHRPLESHPGIHPIADLVDLDLPIAHLDNAKRAWIETIAHLRDVPSDGQVRDVVRRLGQQLEPEFNEANYWVN
jgi:hypothetical protein